MANWLGISRRAVLRLREAGQIDVETVRGHGRDGAKRVRRGSLTALVARRTVRGIGDLEGAHMPVAELPPLHPLEDIAEHYGIPLGQLKEAARNREFSHVHIGRRRYFTPEQLQAYLAAFTKAAEDGPGEADNSISQRRARAGTRRSRARAREAGPR